MTMEITINKYICWIVVYVPKHLEIYAENELLTFFNKSKKEKRKNVDQHFISIV